MKLIGMALLPALMAFGAQQSVVLSGTAGTLAVPATAPFTAMGSMRLEMRIHNMNPTNASNAPIFELNTGYSGGWNTGQFGFQFVLGRLCTTEWLDDSGGGGHLCTAAGMSLAGLDVVMRLQRDVSNRLILAEAFNYQTGAAIPLYWIFNGSPAASIAMPTPAGVVSFAGNLGFGSAGAVCEVAWIKWYSTLVPQGTGYPLQAGAADLGDWRFEGNLTNQGTGGYGAAITPAGAGYAATPTYAPGCNAGASRSFRAGNAAQLDGSGSIAGDESALGYVWQQIPSVLPDLKMQRLHWNTHTTAQPTVTGTVAGPLNLQLTVTQGDGRSTTCTVHHGVVATDANGAVILNTGNAALNDALNTLLTGAQVQYGKNPWPYYDQAAGWNAAAQIAAYDIGATATGTPAAYQPFWNTPAQGTVTVTAGSTTVTGVGTDFLSTVCNSDGTARNPNAAQEDFVVWYPTGRTIEGVAETGRQIVYTSSCASDTQLTLLYAWPANPAIPGGAGLQYTTYYPTAAGSQWGNGGAPANFYDNVQAYYELYYRSGIDTYLIAARKLADRFWTSPWTDRGNTQFGGQYGRANSISGLVLRALDTGDGHADMWAGLHTIWQRYYGYMVNSLPLWSTGGQLDAREYGYSLAQLGYCAMWDPDPNADAPGGMTYQAYCRAAIASAFQAGFNGVFPKNLDGPQQGWLTWWQMKSTYSGMLFNGYPSLGSVQGWSGSTVTLTNGSTAVACTGTNCGWQASDFGTYTIYTGTACASGAVCKHVPVLFTGDGTAAAAAAFPADSSKTDQTVYCLNGCTYIDANHFTLDKPYAGATGTHGWVMAVNNNFAGGSFGMVGWAQDSFLEGILGWAFGMAGKAMACAGAGTPANCDNGVSGLAYGYSQKAANWLLNYAYVPSYGGMSYWAGAAVCGQPIDPANLWCNANTTVNSITSREIMGDAVRGLMAAYQQAPSAGLQAVMDNWYAGMWGKPGTGAVMGTPDGAYDNQFDATGCAVSGSYPVYSGCGGNGFYLTEGPPYSQKFFGQFFGISDLASWPVLRTGGVLTPTNVQVYISGRMADVAGAAKMQVIVTEPTGVTDAPVVCTTSPCAVTVNQAAGNPTIQVQYLSSSGTVLHSGQAFVVDVNQAVRR